MRTLIQLVLILAAPSSLFAAQQNAAAACTASGAVTRVAGLAEASGLAVSRRTPGRLWTHNDSGDPIVFALDASGRVAGQVRLTGAKVEDWEAIAVGPCGSASCLYVGDIGDNEARRDRVTVYRLPEPAAASGSAAVADVFHATYPDGAHDAEALVVGVDGRLHIVTKGETGPIAIYRFPAQLQSAAPMRLERVTAVAAKADAAARITDAAMSPDGEWVALRSRGTLMYYRAAELLGGKARAAMTVDLARLNEPQGEGLALGPDNTVFLAGEGGGKQQPGTFARFTCAPKG